MRAPRSVLQQWEQRAVDFRVSPRRNFNVLVQAPVLDMLHTGAWPDISQRTECLQFQKLFVGESFKRTAEIWLLAGVLRCGGLDTKRGSGPLRPDGSTVKQPGFPRTRALGVLTEQPVFFAEFPMRCGCGRHTPQHQ